MCGLGLFHRPGSFPAFLSHVLEESCRYQVGCAQGGATVLPSSAQLIYLNLSAFNLGGEPSL
jgi:putative component of membrane protein insertase Oxa1/YidC/SpoIIIJ protein YidD